MKSVIVILIIGFLVYLYLRFQNKKSSINQIKFGQLNPTAKKYCVVVDTETTGLPINDDLRATKDTVDNFPEIVEIAWGIFSRAGELISEGDSLIKQKKAIPNSAINIHGITDEMCEKDGRELRDVLLQFASDVKDCECIVAHNVMFDKRIIETEYIRSNLAKPFKGMHTYDTMKLGKRYLKQRKNPKLEELYRHLFNCDVPKTELHRAINDLSLTAQCFFCLKLSGVIDSFFDKTNFD